MAESFIAHSRCVFHYLLYISYARFVYNWYGRSRVDKYSRFRVLVCVFYPNQRIVLFAFFKVWKRGVNVAQIEWIRCPVCGNKTRDRIREDTVLINYPLYCPKCRKESLIQVKQLQIKVIKEPGALDAEPMNLWAITVCRLCSYIATDRTSPPNKKTVFWWAALLCPEKIFGIPPDPFWVWGDFLCVGATFPHRCLSEAAAIIHNRVFHNRG